MIVYRITNEIFKTDISGNGAALFGSRWNSKGVKLLYTSQYISLSILESLVHLERKEIPVSQYLLQIELPDIDNTVDISKSMQKNWQQKIDYTQWIGDQFIKNNQTLILKVPSAIVSQENNLLINPSHKDFGKVKIISAELLELDKRLQEF